MSASTATKNIINAIGSTPATRTKIAVPEYCPDSYPKVTIRHEQPLVRAGAETCAVDLAIALQSDNAQRNRQSFLGRAIAEFALSTLLNIFG